MTSVSAGWSPHLAPSSVRGQRRVHVLPPFVYAIAPMRPDVAVMRCGLPTWAQCGGVRSALAALADGALPPRLGVWTPETGRRAERCSLPLPVLSWLPKAPSLSHRQGVPRRIVRGRVLWPLGDTTEASAAVFPSLWRVPTGGAPQEPTYRRRGILTMLRPHGQKYAHALSGSAPEPLPAPCDQQAPKKLMAIGSPVRKAFAHSFILCCPGCASGRVTVFALGQRYNHFADHVAHPAGETNGNRVRQWFQDKKAAGMRVLEIPDAGDQPLLDQGQTPSSGNVPMKGFHHPVAPTGVAHGACPLVQPHPVISVVPSMGPVWRGSGRRTSTHSRLVPQSADPPPGGFR